MILNCSLMDPVVHTIKARHERIPVKTTSQGDTCVNPSLHTHSVSITDVIKAVNHLKSDKYNDDGILMSNNFCMAHIYYIHVLHNCFLLCYVMALLPVYFYVLL